MNTTEKERADFEAWATANNKHHVSGYNPHSDLFEAWQAARRAPVVPEPQAVIRFERGTPGKENEMPRVVSCNWLPDGTYKTYTEQQVRALLYSQSKGN